MKKIIIHLLAVAVVLTTACNKEEDGLTQMTMTTKKPDVILRIAGSGTMTIDWGDGTEIKTHSLWGYETVWQSSHDYTHFYSGSSARTITITGDNITHLRCADNGLLSLDVSKNTGLLELYCHFNQITGLDVGRNPKLEKLYCGPNQLASLDVSKNPELTELYCGSNQFTSLDVSKNSKLNTLICDGNQLNSLNVKGLTSLVHLNCGRYTYTPEGLGNRLTSLDVSGCSSLSVLNCENNLLPETGLNALFETLHGNMIVSEKNILIAHNPGANDCDKRIAENKGWWVVNRSQ